MSPINNNLNSSWFLEKPYDLEHKIYKMLSFCKGIKSNFESGYWFPDFLTLEQRVKDLESFIENSKLIYASKKDKELLEYIYKLPEDSNEFKEIQKIAEYSYNILGSIYFNLLDHITIISSKISYVNKIKDKRKSPIFFIEKCNTGIIETWKISKKKKESLGSFHTKDYSFLYNEDNFVHVISSINVDSERCIIPIVENYISLKEFS